MAKEHADPHEADKHLTLPASYRQSYTIHLIHLQFCLIFSPANGILKVLKGQMQHIFGALNTLHTVLYHNVACKWSMKNISWWHCSLLSIVPRLTKCPSLHSLRRSIVDCISSSQLPTVIVAPRIDLLVEKELEMKGQIITDTACTVFCIVLQGKGDIC